MDQGFYKINVTRIKERICLLDLKKWWIAEQCRVAPITLRRWLSGKTPRIQENNLILLAKCLECNPEEITDRENTGEWEQHNDDIVLMSEDDFSEDLAAACSFGKMSTTLRMALWGQQTPLVNQAKILNLLSFSSFWEGEYSRSKSLAEKALNLAMIIHNHQVASRSHSLIGICKLILGQPSEGIQHIQKHSLPASDFLSAWAQFCLGLYYWTTGSQGKGVSIMGESLQLFCKFPQTKFVNSVKVLMLEPFAELCVNKHSDLISKKYFQEITHLVDSYKLASSHIGNSTIRYTRIFIANNQLSKAQECFYKTPPAMWSECPKFLQLDFSLTGYLLKTLVGEKSESQKFLKIVKNISVGGLPIAENHLRLTNNIISHHQSNRKIITS